MQGTMKGIFRDCFKSHVLGNTGDKEYVVVESQREYTILARDVVGRVGKYNPNRNCYYVHYMARGFESRAILFAEREYTEGTIVKFTVGQNIETVALELVEME